MSLSINKAYFINQRDVVLRIQADEKTSKNAVNHLILGDYLKYLGETNGEWAKVKCRGNEGWLKTDWFAEQRLLEINFVDIGQGDGCHIVTPDDEVILIDAGEGTGFAGKGGDNMARFISWRYNLRCRSSAAAPFNIDHSCHQSSRFRSLLRLLQPVQLPQTGLQNHQSQRYSGAVVGWCQPKHIYV